MADSSPELTIEIASIARDTSRLQYGGTVLQNYDETLLSRGGGRGLRAYDDIKRDTHAGAVLQIRKLAVIGREWTVEPSGQEASALAAAELVRQQLRTAGLDEASESLLEANLKGFAVLEVMWEVKDNQIRVKELLPKHQVRFVFGPQRELRLLTPEAPYEGVPVPPHKFIVHRFGVTEDNPYGLGLGNSLFWPTFFKRKGITFWLSFCDKFGSPTAVGKYPIGAGPTEQKKLLAALQAIAQEAGVIIPEGMDIKLLETMRSGTINTYEMLCRYMDEQMSEAVLCQTLTTNNGTGASLAATKTHNEVRLEVAKADADRLHSTLNRTLVQWIVDLNMPGAPYPETWRAFPELSQMEKQLGIDERLSKMGFTPTLNYIQLTYGTHWQAPLPKAPVSFAESANQPIDDVVDKSGELATGAMEEMLKPIRRLLGEVKTLREFSERLLEVYPNMPTSQLNQLVGRALVLGSIIGQSEVLDGE
jgi:phage gp29-like protein